MSGAETLHTMLHRQLYETAMSQLDDAAKHIGQQRLRIKKLEALLLRIEPEIGWRSATGTSRDFACEFCHQTHEHFEKIAHAVNCPVTQVREALKEST
jgi:hypothetical protein